MGSAADAPFRPGRVFSLFTWSLLCMLSLALAWGVMHKSSEPAILGRYSVAYFALLLTLAAMAGLLIWLIVAPRPTSVRWAENFYATAISTAVAVTGAEIGMRVVSPWGIELFSLLPYHMQGMVDHPLLGYAHPRSVTYSLGKNRVSLNSHGHRDDEIPIDKPPGERRILVLGDSVTFGWGVDQGEDFPARLEVLLRERMGSAWEVINAGVNGYNSQQEATYFATEGLRLRPDIVLLVYVGNDIDDVFDPNEVTWRRYPTWPSSLPELLDRARSLSYLYQATKLFQRMEQLRPPAPGVPQPSITDHPGWPASLEAVKSILRLCERENIRFLVAMESGAAEHIPAAFAQASIDAITLGPAWSRVPPEKHRVSRIDPHPSATVHAEFARLLFDEVHARGWLESKPAE